MNNMTRILVLIVLCGSPLRAVEFRLLDKLTAKGGIEFSTSATAAPLIFASSSTNPGNVGIGTSSPGAKLEVVGGSVTVRGLDTQNHSFAVGSQSGAFKMVVSTAGNVGIGTTNPAATLDVGGTGAIKIPVGTTAQRPASPATGMMRFNNVTASVEYYNGSAWLAAAGLPTSPVASGGTETTIIDGGVTYKIHTFTANGTFTVTSPGYVEVLVVAGGGSGGNHNTTNANGGGGGGGVIYKKNFAVTPQAYPVTVGAGGVAIGFQVVSRGNNGGNSVFDTLTAIGGGGGGSTGVAGRAYNGGSGGGGAFYGSWAGGGAGIQRDGYGNDGGRSYVSWSGGGGGGAGSVGNSVTIAPNDGPDGNGGRGLGVSITGSLVFYAGGGGGGGNSSERAGDGYDGGGRGFGTTTFYDYNTYPVGTNASTGGSSTPNALPNTGGGGGAGSYWSNNSTGWAGSKGSGAGGSGIVIVRYWISQ